MELTNTLYREDGGNWATTGADLVDMNLMVDDAFQDQLYHPPNQGPPSVHSASSRNPYHQQAPYDSQVKFFNTKIQYFSSNKILLS